MHNLSKRFIATGLLFLMITVFMLIFMGVQSLTSKAQLGYTNASISFDAQITFIYLFLFGVILTLTYGTTYMLLPKHTAKNIHSRSLAALNYWMHSIGTLGLCFTMMMYSLGFRIMPGIETFGAIIAIGVLAFVLNIWKSL